MWIKQSGISPRARTNACSVCGSNKGEALATGIIIEFEGDLEVCVRCIREAAVMLDMVTVEKVAEVEAELAELREWADEVFPELERRDQTISALSNALASTVAERDALREEVQA